MATDIRVKNAKVRVKERTAKMQGDLNEVQDTAKRRKLESIEDQAMKEEDPIKLSELFEQYRAEYIRGRDNKDGDMKRQKVQEPSQMQERATGSQQPAEYVDMEVGRIAEGIVDP